MELATFSRAIRRAAAGRGAVLAVTGAAGVGKTCLLEQVESEAATAGWFVLSDRAPRSRARRSILLELLEGLDPGKHPLDGPARALRSLASGREVPTAALVGGVRWLLEDLVAERQVLLVVDDLPRGDLASVRTLHALRDEIRSLGCLLVFAVADDEPGAELTPGVADLVAELLADARRLTPAPLTRDAVAALARTVRPTTTDAEAADVYRRTAGNPRAVHDLLHLRRVPRRPEDEVRGALAALDPVALDLLRLACLVRRRPAGLRARGRARAARGHGPPPLPGPGRRPPADRRPRPGRAGDDASAVGGAGHPVQVGGRRAPRPAGAGPAAHRRAARPARHPPAARPAAREPAPPGSSSSTRAAGPCGTATPASGSPCCAAPWTRVPAPPTTRPWPARWPAGW